VVVAPSHTLLSNLCNDIIRQLRAKPEMVHLVAERVLGSTASSTIVIQIVYVHVAIAERLARSEMEVAHDLVDTDPSLDTTPLSTLLIQMFRVVFPLALLYILAAAK